MTHVSVIQYSTKDVYPNLVQYCVQYAALYITVLYSYGTNIPMRAHKQLRT